MRIKQDAIIFLTACIHPNGMIDTALQDGSLRLCQYLEAIRFYLNSTTLKILVVENTMVDLGKYFIKEKELGRIECLTFDGNKFERSLGKGYGEGIILEYAFKNSVFIRKCNYIVKISGRHRIVNLNKILAFSEFLLDNKKDIIISEITPKKKFARSDMFIASKSFYINFLNKNVSRCNDSQGIWFEHILYNCIHQAFDDGFHYLYMPLSLDQRGQSGSSGKEFIKTRFRRHVRFFCTMILYKLRLNQLNN